MSSVLGAILFPPVSDPDAHRPLSSTASLQFVNGLTDGEQLFIQDNSNQLATSHARMAADYTVSIWLLFRHLPIVVQLLVMIGVFVAIANIPYVIMYIVRAIQAKESKARMIASLCTAITLIIVIVLVHVFT